MRKCTHGVGKVKALVKAFLREVNTMKALVVKYYLIIKKKRVVILYIIAKPGLTYPQSLHCVHPLPSNPTLKPTPSLHPSLHFWRFLNENIDE